MPLFHDFWDLYRWKTNFSSRSAMLQNDPSGPCEKYRTASGVEFAPNQNDPSQLVKSAFYLSSSDFKLHKTPYIVYRNKGDDVSAAFCGGKWIPVNLGDNSDWKTRVQNINDLSKNDYTQASVQHLSHDIAYLRIPTLNDVGCQSLQNLSIPNSFGQERTLVIDFRTNGGGTDCALPALRHWLQIDDNLIARNIDMTRRQSCLEPALNFSSLQSQIAQRVSSNQPLTQAEKDFDQYYFDALDSWQEPTCDITAYATTPEKHYLDRMGLKVLGMAKKVILLTDDVCSSTCEGYVQLIAQAFPAIVVGVNTGGVGEFVQPISFVLPFTKMPFEMAAGFSNVYGDNRSFEGYGLDVDILLSKSGDMSAKNLLLLIQAIDSNNLKAAP